MCSPCGLMIVTVFRIVAAADTSFPAVLAGMGVKASVPPGSECIIILAGSPVIALPSIGESASLRTIEQNPNLVLRFRVAQRADEIVLAHAADDVFQGSQMVARAV